MSRSIETSRLRLGCRRALSFRVCIQNESMLTPLRRRRSTFWSIVCAFMVVMKAGVPVLAATAAALQGKAVAEICAIYGVRTSVQASAELARAAAQADAASAHLAHAGHAGHAGHASHATHAEHSHDAGSAMGGDAQDPPSPHGAAKDREHCALTGLAVCAVPAVAPLEAAAWLAALQGPAQATQSIERTRDASARWLTERIHAPPLTA